MASSTEQCSKDASFPNRAALGREPLKSITNIPTPSVAQSPRLPSSKDKEGLKPYATQMSLIESKAAEHGIELSELTSIYGEKIALAKSRFSTESRCWQAWFAESSVWARFFKEMPFPGEEPERRYFLHSTGNTYSDSLRSAREPSSGSHRLVSREGRLDRQGELEDFKNKQISREEHQTPYSFYASVSEKITGDCPQRASGEGRVFTSKDEYLKPEMEYVQSRTTSDMTQDNMGSKIPSPVDDVPLSQASGAATYLPQEKVMEKMAVRTGMRREFFQYVQKARDTVRAEHPGCTSHVRGFLADKMIWTKFFTNQPFPGIKPVGGHSPKCTAAMVRNKASRPSKTSGKSSLAISANYVGRVSTHLLSRVDASAKSDRMREAFGLPAPPASDQDTYTKENYKHMPTTSSGSLDEQWPLNEDYTDDFMFEDPQKLWATYMEKFNATDVDCLIVEESAKAEGQLRMVLDEENGQVITLAEYAQRIRYRCRFPTPNKLEGVVRGDEKKAEAPRWDVEDFQRELTRRKRLAEDEEADDESVRKRQCLESW